MVLKSLFCNIAIRRGQALLFSSDSHALATLKNSHFIKIPVPLVLTSCSTICTRLEKSVKFKEKINNKYA